MLKQLRSNTKIIMIIVVIFFVGMIVFQWGMDIGGQRKGVQSGVIGEINGVEIKYENYDALIRNQRDTLGSNQPLTYQQERQLHEQVWDYIVTNVLIEQEIEKRGITYTDKELVNYMLSNPPQVAYQIPAFFENDAFSLTKYKDFLQDPNNFDDPQGRQLLNYIETEAERSLPRIKLQQSLDNGLFVRESEVREKWLMENEQRKIDWLFVSAADLGQYPGEVETDDIIAYYEEHRDDYKHEELRSLDTVSIEMLPTSADTTEVIERAKLLAQRAHKGEDFAELADGYSEDPGNQDSSGKRLGGSVGFFGKGRMVKEFEDVAFNMKPGEISDPFLSSFGIHIVKVDSLLFKEDSSEVDQVQARHILMKIIPSGQTRERVENKVKAFYESVNGGMDFALRAQIDTLQVSRTPLFQKGTQYIPGIGMNVQLLLKRAFQAKKDDILPPYITDTGYYVFKVSEIRLPGIAPFEEVIDPVTEDFKNQMRLDYAEEHIRRISEILKGGMDLVYATPSIPDTLITAEVKTETVTRNNTISGLGTMNKFMARVFGLENVGDNTGPVVTESGCGIAVFTEKIPVDETKYEEEKNELKERLQRELTNTMMARFINNLKDNAEITDNRDLFLGL